MLSISGSPVPNKCITFGGLSISMVMKSIFSFTNVKINILRSFFSKSVVVELAGNITMNKGMNKLTLRGQLKVNAQWQLRCLVHNIEKLRSSTH
jgi:hypothetical protein